MGEGVFSIQSHDARKSQFAHIVPTPGIVRILAATLMSCTDIDYLAANSFRYCE